MSRLSSTSLPWYRSLRASRARDMPVCIHTALEAAAVRAPARRLLIDRGGCMSRGQLVDAMQLRGRHLLDACGKADGVVAVRLSPGLESVITYFACLAAGLRYLPLPDCPPAVMERMLESLEPDLLVADKSIEAPETIQHYDVSIESASPASTLPVADPHRIAHWLPTSGTETGTPKVVLTDHVGSMLSHAWRTGIWGYRDDDVVGCNIFGIWDVVPALCNGIPVVMIDDETIRDPISLASMIVQYGITRLMLTPTLLDACLACDDGVDALIRLKRIVLCGEVVSPAVLRRARERLPQTNIANLYSVSECHDVAAIDLDDPENITAGHIADFAEVHITDPDDTGRLLPVGEAGRVLIGGQGLAVGYLDDELTHRRFFNVVFEAGRQRVYDTGDLGRLEADGRLTILGRTGDTVKVRGAWAEPDSIEAILLQHPGVRRAHVLANEDGSHGTQLAAFIVPVDGEAPDTVPSLYAWLDARMPSQSVPSHIRLIDDLPLMPSGKVDQRRLRDMLREEPGDVEVAEDDSATSAVVHSFMEVLARTDVGPDSDFFSLGGDSLFAIALCGAIQSRTGRRVRVADVYEYRTPAALSHHLEQFAGAKKSGWRLPALDLDVTLGTPAGGVERVLITGAGGLLGSALTKHLLEETELNVVVLLRGRSPDEVRSRMVHALGSGVDSSRLECVVGDLAEPHMGLSRADFDELAKSIDAIVHGAADLSMFASYEALAGTNVGGTRELLHLALCAGARFCHVSSSAIFPLDPQSKWDESSHGLKLSEKLAHGLENSDGYSRSKLAAEALVWQAFDLGLQGSVVRLPHLVGSGVDSRLVNTVSLLAETGMLPEGEWSWQVVTPARVSRDLAVCLLDEPQPLLHSISTEIRRDDVIDLFEVRGIETGILPMPALVSELMHFQTDDMAFKGLLASMNQLIAEYGPWAAFSLADARLESSGGMDENPRLLLDELVLGKE